jgi:hypothetical protein
MLVAYCFHHLKYFSIELSEKIVLKVTALFDLEDNGRNA